MFFISTVHAADAPTYEIKSAGWGEKTLKDGESIQWSGSSSLMVATEQPLGKDSYIEANGKKSLGRASDSGVMFYMINIKSGTPLLVNNNQADLYIQYWLNSVECSSSYGLVPKEFTRFKGEQSNVDTKFCLFTFEKNPGGGTVSFKNTDAFDKGIVEGYEKGDKPVFSKKLGTGSSDSHSESGEWHPFFRVMGDGKDLPDIDIQYEPKKKQSYNCEVKSALTQSSWGNNWENSGSPFAFTDDKCNEMQSGFPGWIVAIIVIVILLFFVLPMMCCCCFWCNCCGCKEKINKYIPDWLLVILCCGGNCSKLSVGSAFQSFKDDSSSSSSSSKKKKKQLQGFSMNVNTPTVTMNQQPAMQVSMGIPGMTMTVDDPNFQMNMNGGEMMMTPGMPPMPSPGMNTSGNYNYSAPGMEMKVSYTSTSSHSSSHSESHF